MSEFIKKEPKEVGKIMKLKKDSLVKQNNALITAKHSLSQVQLKIVLSLLGQINRTDEDFKDYIFNIQDFFSCIDGDSNKNYTFIKNSIKDILSKPLEIKTEEGHLLCNWLSSAETNANTGLIRLRFDPVLKPYLLQLKSKFTVFHLEHILVLNSIYSIRLYEMIKRFESTGFYTVSIEELRWMLEIPNTYRLNNIKDLLNKAKEEISSKTDIQFGYKLKKLGRSFKNIEFKIRPTTKSKIEKLLKPFAKNKEDRYKNFYMKVWHPYKTGELKLSEEELMLVMEFCMEHIYKPHQFCYNYQKDSIFSKEESSMCSKCPIKAEKDKQKENYRAVF
jgi:plasmid replication initiation protein